MNHIYRLRILGNCRNHHRRHTLTYRLHTGDTNGTTAHNAEDFYTQYAEAKDRLRKFDEEQEVTKSAKMFDAWQKQSGNATTAASSGQHRSTGIAVVRTLASETKNKSTTQERASLEQTARDLLDKAANVAHHPLAMLQLGNNLLQDGKATEAMEYYRKAGEVGSGEAWFNLGHCLWEGVPSQIEPDIEQAIAAFRKAIHVGDLDSMYFMAVHMLGKSENATVEELRYGLQCVEQAAAAHHGKAMHYLAIFYKNGFPALQIEPCTDIDFIDRVDAAVACDTSGEALFLRGSCRWSGDAYEVNVREALHDFLKASDMGQSDAAVSAGAILHKGVPGLIEQDQSQAFHLYQHAGELGNIEGWRNVVACYATGEGAPRSMSMAKYIAELLLRYDEQSDNADHS